MKDWDEATTDRISATLDTLLDGVGDPDHQREFVMCITLCRHRALTDDEYAALPAWWHETTAVDVAGAPLRVRWNRGIPDTPSTQPCANPGRVRVSETLWLPQECGLGDSCQARECAAAQAGCAIRRPW